MEKNDFENFKQEVSWFVGQNDSVEIRHIISKTFSPELISTFPALYKLLLQSTSILSVDITTSKNKKSNYYLYTWTDRNGLKCGWLCKTEKIQTEIDVIAEHQLLLNEMGGITETYHHFDTEAEMLTDNQNFIFTQSLLTKGLGDWIDLYDQVCKDENVKQTDTKDLICFAEEANGNETFYDPDTKQVLLFAPDHSFENVEVLKGQPEYTFYTINHVTTFVDYVETLARQWLENIITEEL
ncbi:hypothetical protein [Chryseobacterium luteum]|uniref:Knr4/Smi1-like domain-containing protein n=1 Tax=Chryseobacterium luteum TaxID=421531 RepID=A0A085ZF56_9FLAO|nr:hypothetical protein [Chryseobacterium luteum]KFF03070.1 hypothetical protein IX38_11900 [Chryseobacterium luteum]